MFFYHIWAWWPSCLMVRKHLNKWQYPFDRRSHVKSGENCSSGLREEEIFKLHNFIDVYCPGARADNPQQTKC